MPSEPEFLSALLDRLEANLPSDDCDEMIVYAGDLRRLIAALRAGEALVAAAEARAEAAARERDSALSSPACEDCNGKGTLRFGEKTLPCPACHGTGRKPGEDRDAALVADAAAVRALLDDAPESTSLATIVASALRLARATTRVRVDAEVARLTAESDAARVAEGEAMLALESAEHRLARALVAGAVLLRRAREALARYGRHDDGHDDRFLCESTRSGPETCDCGFEAARASLSCGEDAPPDATVALAEAFAWVLSQPVMSDETPQERATDLARQFLEGGER